MSHFTVLVIGDNVEEQLSRYDENIEMPPTDQGAVDNDEIARFIEYYTKGKDVKIILTDNHKNAVDLYKKHGKDWNGGSWRLHTDGKYHEWSTYNPNSKWDWWVVGGRWTGFFKPKDGKGGKLGEPGVFGNKAEKGWVDSLAKGDIDFEFMRNEDGKAAEERWNLINSIVGELPEHEAWSSLTVRLTETFTIDDARKFYHEQPRLKAIAAKAKEMGDAWPFGFFFDLEDYCIPKDEYIKSARDGAGITFAVVKDGEWYEKGKMGWWGIATDKVSQSEWNAKFAELLDGLSDDTILTVVDCHI